jgi:hypothetical protein
MLFMVVEHFRDNDMIPVYRRFRQAGRSLPEGLDYVDSWVEANFSRCFQLMRGDVRNRARRLECRDAGNRRAVSRTTRAAALRTGGRLQQVDNVTL